MRRYRVPLSQIRDVCGGMGVWITNSETAQAVSLSDPRALGVVSGVAIREVYLRTLQNGDPGGHLRRAMRYWPGDRSITRRILNTYLLKGGIPNAKYLKAITYSEKQRKFRQTVDAVAGFCAVWLAEHAGKGKIVPVGLNLLTKVEEDLMPIIYGAMLAGLGFLFMGAGIPDKVPALLKELEQHKTVQYRLTVEGALAGEVFTSTFDPSILGATHKKLQRPVFIAIVASDTLAIWMQRAGADAVVFENETAGGHNAPDDANHVDWDKVKKRLHIPYGIAGGYAAKENRWQTAKEVGASFIQFGTPYVFTVESGMAPELKDYCLVASYNQVEGFVKQDKEVSPSGMPFMVADVPGTLSDQLVRESSSKECTQGYLQTYYRKQNGTLGRRCPASSIAEFERKGGDVSKCKGKACPCRGLLKTCGLGDDDYPAIVTLGLDTSCIRKIADFVGVKDGKIQFTASDVTRYLMQGVEVLDS